MIDEKINQTLSELESTLRNVESAREQVHSTVSSFNGLTRTTQEYVGELGNIVREVKELEHSIGQDYNKNKEAFEKDRNTIINASNEAIEKLSNATEKFKDSLSNIQKKLKYCLALNIVSLLVAITAIVLLLMKMQ